MQRVGTLAGAAAASLIPGGRLWASSPKRLSVIGGTDFVGPAVVEAGEIAGYRVTLFNRGITNPAAFPSMSIFTAFARSMRKIKAFRSCQGDFGTRQWTCGHLIPPWLARSRRS